MIVTELWRYPVKSMQGERLDTAEITTHGLHGDRSFALFDARSGIGLTARRVPELLMASARLLVDGTLSISLPDGSAARDDDALSAWLGRPVHLRGVDEPGERVYENPDDAEDEAGAWSAWDGSPGNFHDSRRTHVSLVSAATYGSWPPRRFRANVLLDGSGEDRLVGARIRLGGAVLDVGKRVDRCVMVTRPQPDGIERDLDVLRTIHRERDGYLAIGAVVTEPGRVVVGAELSIA